MRIILGLPPAIAIVLLVKVKARAIAHRAIVHHQKAMKFPKIATMR